MFRRAEWRSWFARQIAIETDARTGFILVPIGMMIGIIAVHGLGWRPTMVFAASVTVFVFLIYLTASRIAVAGAAQNALFVAGFILLGATLSEAELARNDTLVFSGEATVRINGRVLWRDRDERGRLRYLVAIMGTDRPVLSRPPTRAEILVSSKHDPIPLGADYRGLVRLRAPSGPAYPDGYDFAFGAFFKGLGAYGYALGPPEPRSPQDKDVALSIDERLVALRLWISDRIRGSIPGAEGAVASAIITGERTGIPEDVNLWLRTTGISHVLSISGLHMALVAGFAMTLLRLAFAAIPVLALRWPAKKLSAIVALGVSAFYLALSGFDVATTRSFVMIAIMLIAVVFDRSALTLRNVAIAAIIVLALSPHALLTASFQMSFGATAAIIAAYGILGRWKRDRDDDGLRERSIAAAVALFLLGIAASSMVAGTATAPFAAYHFQRIAPYGLIANMLTLPIFSFWIMPLALISMIAMPFGLDMPFLWLMGQGLSLVFSIARWLHDRLPDNPTGLLTTAGLFCLTSALVAGCFFSSALRLVAVPIGAIGILLAPSHAPLPDLLVFEDGKEVALVGSKGELVALKPRPNAFVFEQWLRAFPARIAEEPTSNAIGFVCESIVEPIPVFANDPSATTQSPSPGARQPKPRTMKYCRATTRSGLEVVWTDDYRKVGRACNEADVAIVARAIRLEACRSTNELLTLRTLRTTGSVSISREAKTGQPIVRRSVPDVPDEWNVHRLAAWPEAWRDPSRSALSLGIPTIPPTEPARPPSGP